MLDIPEEDNRMHKAYKYVLHNWNKHEEDLRTASLSEKIINEHMLLQA